MKKEDLEILREYREKENQKIYAPHFIGQYKNALTNKFCDLLVNFADRVVDGSGDSVREDPEAYGHANYRKDWALYINDDPKNQRIINEALDISLRKYTDEYMGAYYSGKVISIYQKLQVSPPNGGFHGWHCEHSGFESMERVLAWMFYLNDMPDGEAETEFLHQRCRLKPEKGKCVIFPASFTHTHRANPPLTQNKYILTGWYNLAQVA